jgi:hypothetical protein
MGVIIQGKDIEIPNLAIQNYQQEPKFKLKPIDGRKRPHTWVRGIVLHTTKGLTPQTIKPGLGPNYKRDEKVAQMWSLDSRRAGAHLIVDSDASWVCTCDLQEFAAYHAGNVNSVTIGIEIYQESKGSLYQKQLESVITMVDFLTRHFSIQRQIHWPYHGHAIKRGLQRGIDMVGVYGHRDCSNNRGHGDPGDSIFQMLRHAGYESFDFQLEEDKGTWEERQKNLNLLPDGIPGPRTVTTLKKCGYKHGLWISRPGD